VAASHLSLAEILTQNEKQILDDWTAEQLRSGTLRRELISDVQLRQESQALLAAVVSGMRSGDGTDISTPAWSRTRDLLVDLSESRAKQGFTASETAIFVFSLKSPVLRQVQEAYKGASSEQTLQAFWTASSLLDQLGLHTTAAFQAARESVIRRQQEEMMELSTPVVQLFEGVLALPLIGTLDSARTQVVMENLLERIVSSGARIAILDITGVPTVDTLVAQHLLKTVAAARLMGADCIISGIRPQIAQTIVHLGVELNNVTTKATLADALAVALRRLGYAVQKATVTKE
jgi:rsbT co-antagonist protein RsbR